MSAQDGKLACAKVRKGWAQRAHPGKSDRAASRSVRQCSSKVQSFSAGSGFPWRRLLPPILWDHMWGRGLRRVIPPGVNSTGTERALAGNPARGSAMKWMSRRKASSSRCRRCRSTITPTVARPTAAVKSSVRSKAMPGVTLASRKKMFSSVAMRSGHAPARVWW